MRHALGSALVRFPPVLIDVHAHFLHDRTPRADWRERNASRLRAGERVGHHDPRRLDSRQLGPHLADLLPLARRLRPTATTACSRFSASIPTRIRGYVAVNPNYTDHALAEIRRVPRRGHDRRSSWRRAAAPTIRCSIRSARSRRERGVPVLHHIWQHRRRDYPGQEASDAIELGRLARTAQVACTSSSRTSAAVVTGSIPCPRSAGLPNVLVDLSGSGVDGGMLEACVEAVGVERLLWGCDLTIETGLGQAALPRAPALAGRSRPRALAQRRADLPARRVPLRLMRIDVNAFLGSYPYPTRARHVARGAARGDGSHRHRQAWVSHLPGIFWRDPAAGNAWLYEIARAAADGCGRCLAVHPEMAGWESVVREAAEAGRPGGALRSDVLRHRAGGSVDARARRPRAAAPASPLMLAVRLEDGRQRHPNDHAAELPAAAVRALVRADAAVRLIVTHADRPFVEEVHFGSTPDEARRILVGHLLDLGPAGGSPRDAAAARSGRAVRLRHRPAAPDSGERRRQARPARSRPPPTAAAIESRQRSTGSRAADHDRLARRIEWGLLPAVPVPFRGDRARRGGAARLRRAGWRTQPVAGVAVWAHTGRGPHLSAEHRREVLETWREALPDRVIVAGARDITMAIEARRGRADALLAFPERNDPVGYHRRLGRELPVIAFYLYEAAGGVAYDDAHAARDPRSAARSSASRSPRSTR